MGHGIHDTAQGYHKVTATPAAATRATQLSRTTVETLDGNVGLSEQQSLPSTWSRHMAVKRAFRPFVIACLYSVLS
jgi:hypothetical protein